MAKKSKKTSPLVNSLADTVVWLGQKSFGKPAHGIILFTLGSHLLILPLNLKMAQIERKGVALQPTINSTQQKYSFQPGQNLPGEQQAMQAELIQLFRRTRIDPRLNILLFLPQVPILWLLHRTMRAIKTDPRFAEGSGILWFQDLSKPDPRYVLPALVVFLSFVNYRMQLNENDNKLDYELFSPEWQRGMRLVRQLGQLAPLIVGIRAIRRPASEGLYTLTSSAFAIFQQYLAGGWGSLAELPGLGFLSKTRS